jgi:V8-like Glu-specific endopeptidase
VNQPLVAALLCSLALLPSALADFSGLAQDAIIKGDPVRSGSEIERHAVLLQFDNSSCTGTVIAPDIALTAAHCVKRRPRESWARFGKDGQAAKRRVVSYLGHPEYSGNQRDIAVVRFEGGLPEGYSPAPALDGSSGAVPAGTEVIAAGYGQTSGYDNQAGYLHAASFQIVQSGSWEVFMKGQGTNSTCYGDSGGPAYVEHEGELLLFGVVSGSYGANDHCEGGVLIFSRVDTHEPWIISTIQQLRGKK